MLTIVCVGGVGVGGRGGKGVLGGVFLMVPRCEVVGC